MKTKSARLAKKRAKLDLIAEKRAEYEAEQTDRLIKRPEAAEILSVKTQKEPQRFIFFGLN